MEDVIAVNIRTCFSQSMETMYAVDAYPSFMCKMLDVIQDHCFNAQPGVQWTVFKLKVLVRRRASCDRKHQNFFHASIQNNQFSERERLHALASQQV